MQRAGLRWVLVTFVWILSACPSGGEDGGTAGVDGTTAGISGLETAGQSGASGIGGTAGDGGAAGSGATAGVSGVAGTSATAGALGTAGVLATAGVGTAGVDGGGTAGVGGSAGFPHGDDVNVALKGPYTVKMYEMTDPDWNSATMYYPEGAPEPMAAMAVSPGFTETKENMTWWAEMLASHGFVVLSTSPFNTGTDQPPDRGKDLVTAVNRIIAENTKADSPLKGKIATDRIALSGHSMGGGGTLHAAAELKDKVRAAIPLMEHCPVCATTPSTVEPITAALFFIAGELDGEPLGPPGKYSLPQYMSATNAHPRAVGVIKGGDHFLGVNGGAHHEDQARYAVAWLKMYLEDDLRYEPYVWGDKHTPEIWSTWMTTK